jgi:D-3-phosphoglycerate dehydrogenase
LKVSDIISIHVHLTNETHNLLNSTNLDHVKDGCFIINTSRGNVWDEDALLDVFKSGKIKGIATDVLADELENIKESAILKMHKKYQNIIITPHLGGATFDAMWSCEKYLANFVTRSLSEKASDKD